MLWNIVLFAQSIHTVNSITLILCSEASTESLINWRIRIVVIFGPIMHKPLKIQQKKMQKTQLLLNIV